MNDERRNKINEIITQLKTIKATLIELNAEEELDMENAEEDSDEAAVASEAKAALDEGDQFLQDSIDQLAAAASKDK